MKKILYLLLIAIPLFSQHTDLNVSFGTGLSADQTKITGRTTTLVNTTVYYSGVTKYDNIRGTYSVAAKITQLTGTSTFRLQVRLYSSTVGFSDWEEIFVAGQAAGTVHTFTYTTEAWWEPWASGTQYRLQGAGTGTATIDITETIN